MRFKSMAGRSRVALLASVVAAVTGVVFAALNDDKSDAATQMAVGLDALALLCALPVVVIAVSMWIHGAHKNLYALHPHAIFEFTPGWSVGWFFVPFAWFWKPFQAMKELWIHSNPEGAVLSTVAPSPLLVAWWTCWLAANFLGRFANEGMGMTLFVLLMLGALGCLLALMRQITSGQNEMWERMAAAPTLRDTLTHAAHADRS